MCRWTLWPLWFLSKFVTQKFFSRKIQIIMTLSVPDKVKLRWLSVTVNSVTRTNWRMQVSSTVWFHFPAEQCACSHSKVGSRLDCHQLQWMYWQRWMATKLARRYPSWLSRLGNYAWTLKDFCSQPKNADGLKKILQLIWNQLRQDSINKAILSFKKTLSLCERRDGHLERALRRTV